MRIFVAYPLALAMLAACVSGAQLSCPESVSNIAAAVADPARPASDTALDAQRRGPEILAFAGVRPGWRIGDLMQGAGYFTRLWVAAAGPKGKVYAWSPPEFIAAKKALYGDSLGPVVI